MKSWSRLLTLLDYLEISEDCGETPKDEALRLRVLVYKILGSAGGLNLWETDFHEPAGGALAEHAFAVLARELAPQDPAWALIIEDIQKSYHRDAGPLR